jgi:hypothetical protein
MDYGSLQEKAEAIDQLMDLYRTHNWTIEQWLKRTTHLNLTLVMKRPFVVLWR